MPDPLPFEELYRLHASAVYRFCVFMLRNANDAEDVTADVFTSALRAYERMQPDPQRIRSWLFRIARNTVIDRRRRSERFGRLFRLLSRDISADVEQDVVVRDDLRHLKKALARLNPRDRTLISLRFAGGLSFSEIASLTNSNEKAASMATLRAVDKIRAMWDEIP